MKSQFPLFKKPYNGKNLIYLDSAATVQLPESVIDAITDWYRFHNSNVGRGIYQLAEHATLEFEKVRKKTAQFINASSEKDIVFTKGATGALNFVVQAFKHNVRPGDEIVVSQSEHHAQFVPWQKCAEEKGAIVKILPVTDTGLIDESQIDTTITDKTKVVAVQHVSNATGSVNLSLKKIIKKAHEVGAVVSVDGAQAVGYQSVDVQDLNCDFYALSSHKMCGPSGVGVLYIKPSMHEKLQVPTYGGGAVYEVTNEKTSLLQPPHCYEPGTPAVAQVVGFGAAIDFLNKTGLKKIHDHTNQLVNQLLDVLQGIPQIKVIGDQDHLRNYSHLVSFTIDGIHPHDVAAFLDTKGICVRAGHHCVQPLARRLGYDSSIRVSFYLYNDAHEVDYLVASLKELIASL